MDKNLALDVSQNTMSANLLILARSGLILSKWESSGIRFFADMTGKRGLLAFLMVDCRDGRPDLCQLVINEIACP